MITMTMGDMLDRWTILRMKVRVDDASKGELDKYNSCGIMVAVESPTWRNNAARLLELVTQLAEANGKIWMLEASIRNGESMEEAEVGRRAIEIREHNKLRVEAKNEINRIFGEAQDKKLQHASE